MWKLLNYIYVGFEILAAPTTKGLVVRWKFTEGMEKHIASVLRIRELVKQEIRERERERESKSL
jgi:hypothetical protein